jgi:DNA-binding transcriptional ArsR family regulator
VSVRLDADGVRALAHPLRSRLLSALRTDGAATATVLAERLDTNTGATSYHLRKLAEVGLVVDTGEGRGRERVWRAGSEMHSWSDRDLADDADAQAASAWLRGHYLRGFVDQAEQWLSRQDRWPMTWRAVAGSSDYLLDISAERLERLQSELHETVERYRRAEAGSASGEVATDGPTERVVLFQFTFPVDRTGATQPHTPDTPDTPEQPNQMSDRSTP